MPRPKPTPRTAVAGLLVGLLALGAVAGCSGSSSSEAGPSGPPRPKVIATTPIVADLVTMVAGDEVEVSTLIPPVPTPTTSNRAPPTPPAFVRVRRSS